MHIIISIIQCTLDLTLIYRFAKIFIEKMSSQTDEKSNGVIYL
jgi:hypothetical protein